MARKKQEPEKKKKVNTDGIMGLHGSTTEQAISETLELNYMPYAMSVIVSRAIPEIDGFKPSHRKLLHHVQNGSAHRWTDEIRQYCRPDHAPEPPRRRRHL